MREIMVVLVKVVEEMEVGATVMVAVVMKEMVVAGKVAVIKVEVLVKTVREVAEVVERSRWW